jgi:hypothetical protein
VSTAAGGVEGDVEACTTMVVARVDDDRTGGRLPGRHQVAVEHLDSSSDRVERRKIRGCRDAVAARRSRGG